MERFIDLIKKIAINAVESRKPIEICYGTVISKSPFKVKLSQTQIYDKNFFDVREGVTASSFEVGDILILFRFQGGQRYLIFDKKGEL